MGLHFEDCIAEAKAAGWSDAAVARIVLAPKSETLQGFRAKLAEANEIRAMVKIAGSSIKAAGFDPEGAADYFVAAGISCEAVREDTVRIMAVHDEETAIDTTPRAKNPSNVYTARAAEIDEHKGKSRG